MEMQGYSAKGIVSEFDLHSFARIKLFVWVWSNSSLHSYNTKYTVYVYLYTTALETRQTFWAIPDSKCLERKKKKKQYWFGPAASDLLRPQADFFRGSNFQLHKIDLLFL